MLKLFRKTYNSKREAEIELFFKHVNWYKLLKAWGLFPTFAEASDTVFEYKQKAKSIKKVWLNNQNQSLPQVLALMGILPLKHIKRGKGSNLTEWYFADINELLITMGLPEMREMITTHRTYIFGIKRKHFIYSINKI